MIDILIHDKTNNIVENDYLHEKIKSNENSILIESIQEININFKMILSELLDSYCEIWSKLMCKRKPIRPRFLRTHKNNIPLLYHYFKVLEQL